jgi:transposase InsO family protein
MPWRECTYMSQREEFVSFATMADANVSALCRRFGISRPTGYKWLRRAREGAGSLQDRSRRPRTSPRRTPAGTEALVCEWRRLHPAWGGRKLHHALRLDGIAPLPSPSTITRILDRSGRLSAERRLVRDWQRFEAEAANKLWQMDFKGPISTTGGPCHALTVLDDYSRFNICLSICPNQQRLTVQAELVKAFQLYGLPECILTDNGPPWGSGYAGQPYTQLAAWLIRNGVRVSHGRPYHPQTQGKDERFHRTFDIELLASRPVWLHSVELGHDASAWRDLYNYRRPHEAIGQEPPISRYQPSPRPYTAALVAIEYAPGDEVRKVQQKGVISFRGRNYLVGRAFTGEPVGLRPVREGAWDVYYCFQRVSTVDLTAAAPDL